MIVFDVFLNDIWKLIVVLIFQVFFRGYIIVKYVFLFGYYLWVMG